MRVRPAEVADIARLMAIERQAGTAAHWSELNYNVIFTEPSPRRICLVVEFATEDSADALPPAAPALVGGFVVALCFGGEWEIENVAVDPALRRRGVAKKLLEELLRQATAEGVRRIFLEVRESNRPARDLYAVWGFAEAGRRAGYYSNPEEDAILLQFWCNNSVKKVEPTLDAC